MNISKLQNSLPMIEGSLNFDTMEFEMTKPHSFVRDGLLCIATDYDDHAGDYYGEYRGGCPHINEKLMAWAKEHNGYFEWFDASYFVFNAN